MNQITLECKILIKEDITRQEAEEKGLRLMVGHNQHSDHIFQIQAVAPPGQIAEDLHQVFRDSRILIMGSLSGDTHAFPRINIESFRVILRP